MAYRVFIDKTAEKDIDRLPKNTRKLVLEEIKELAKDPRKPRAEPLEGKLKPYWKTRVGDYRIAYEIRDDQVRRCPDISLAKAKLRWEPTIPLRDGLVRTIDYFRSHLGDLLK